MQLREPIPLDRAFSRYLEPTDTLGQSDDEPPTHESGATVGWDAVLERRIVIVLGERGLGKTTELKARAALLERSGTYAFFIPLYRIKNPDQLRMVFSELGPRLSEWSRSGEPACFFLDSIDESRAIGALAFEDALALFIDRIRDHLGRVSIVMSSRIPDWNLARTRETVERHIVTPLVAAGGAKEALAAEAFRLQPLSEADVMRLAHARGVPDVNAFWDAVRAGGYEYMATRPLDLEWMAEYWIHAGRLGTYTELIEASISNRLTETNQTYLEARVVTSVSALRELAEQLAAICSFSDRPFIALRSNAAAPNAVTLTETLPDPLQHERLLHSALFHEASFGLMQFHHRFAREYLAACWVRKRIDAGLPLSRAMKLFFQSYEDNSILLESRIAELSWLASMHGGVRDLAIRSFPEIALCEGDPVLWGESQLLDALDAYLHKLHTAPHLKLHGDWSQLRRFARALPPGALAQRIEKNIGDWNVLSRLLSLVDAGAIADVAPLLMKIYRTSSAPDCSADRHIYLLGRRMMALNTLHGIATPDMRDSIAADIAAGAVNEEYLAAHAVQIAGLSRLTTAQIEEFIRLADTHKKILGHSAYDKTVWEFIASANVEQGVRLLDGMVRGLPQWYADGLRRMDAKTVKHAWLNELLPECLLRVLELMPGGDTPIPSDLLCEAGVLVERLGHLRIFLRDLDFTSFLRDRPRQRVPMGDPREGVFDELHQVIDSLPAFRRQLVVAIAASDSALREHLVEGRGLIALSADDLEWLTAESNSTRVTPSERTALYELARDVVLIHCKGARRRRTLEALIDGDSARREDIADRQKARARTLREGPQSRIRLRLRNQRVKAAAFRERLLAADSSGATDFGVLAGMIGALRDEPLADLMSIVTSITYHFGAAMGAAFERSLRDTWRNVTIQNPLAYRTQNTPAETLVGVVSLQDAIRRGLAIQALSLEDARRAIQLAIWDQATTARAIAQLGRSWPKLVREVLAPLLEAEITAEPVRNARNRVLGTVLACGWELTESFLLRALTLIEEGRVATPKVRYNIVSLLPVRTDLRDRIVAIALRELQSDSYIGPALNGLMWPQPTDDPIATQAGWAPSEPQPSFGTAWFRVLVRADFVVAMGWVGDRLATADEEHRMTLLDHLAFCLLTSGWSNAIAGTAGEVKALLWLYRTLDSTAAAANRSIDSLRNSVPRLLAKLPGVAAHHALCEMAAMYVDDESDQYFRRLLSEHATAEATRRQSLKPADIVNFSDPYTREPRTADELFEQVLARLEEIREAVEKGPFSDRGLFSPGMKEKLLQIWLAARLSDTPRRSFVARFQTHREPQVDLDNRTDVEVSSASGKVCIEIKPLDRTRYSAQELRDALETQLVGRYLRGMNSRHGILLLMQLEKRHWQIPGGDRNGDLAVLVTYLQEQANQIRARHPQVAGLRVMAVDCTVP